MSAKHVFQTQVRPCWVAHPLEKEVGLVALQCRALLSSQLVHLCDLRQVTEALPTSILSTYRIILSPVLFALSSGLHQPARGTNLNTMLTWPRSLRVRAGLCPTCSEPWQVRSRLPEVSHADLSKVTEPAHWKSLVQSTMRVNLSSFAEGKWCVKRRLIIQLHRQEIQL